jgi:putative transposase
MIELVAQPDAFGHRSELCRSLGLSKATTYRRILSSPSQADPDERLREQVERIAKENRLYGHRRIAAQLAREGVAVSRKKVLRLAREADCLVRPKKRFAKTTDSSHGMAVYKNLKPYVAVGRINVLWVADITYVRLPGGFCYLAVVIDAYSRRVVGWALSERIDARLTLSALRMAIASRGAPLYHHSDRGVQYACAEYVAELAAHQVQMSMSRKGNPYDNAGAESFMKTLKCEEVYLKEYTDMDDAKANLDDFIEAVYNRRRLHSALGYLPPMEFEDKLL